MALDFILSVDPPQVCMIDEDAAWAFGPVVRGSDCMERLMAFLNAVGDDPRAIPIHRLDIMWAAWEMQNPSIDTDGLDHPDVPRGEPEPNPPARDDAVTDDVAVYHAPDGSPQDAGAEPAEPPQVDNPAAPADPITMTGNPSDDSAKDDVPVTPPNMPVGSRICWNCSGRRIEPNTPDTPCGICVGKGWLPA